MASIISQEPFLDPPVILSGPVRTSAFQIPSQPAEPGEGEGGIDPPPTIGLLWPREV